MTEQQQRKQQAIDLLESRYRGMENVCEGIDMRLREGEWRQDGNAAKPA